MAKKKPQTPSQHEITVRDRRALNKKIAALTGRIDGLGQRVAVLEAAIDQVLHQLPSAKT